MLCRLLICLLVLCSVPAGAQWEWRSRESYLRDSTLIAILRVGEVHQALTPEAIRIQSATAKVERVIWYQFAAGDKLPDTVIVFHRVCAPSRMVLYFKTGSNSARNLAVSP